MKEDSHFSSAEFGGVSLSDSAPAYIYHKDVSQRLHPTIVLAGFGAVDWPI